MLGAPPPGSSLPLWPPDQSPQLWSWQASTDAEVDVPSDANALAGRKGRLVQRIGSSRHVALLPYRGPPPERLPKPDAELCVDELWPREGVPVDMRAAFPPGLLAQRYDDAVWGSAPVALFAKQVLAKARSVLTQEVYTNEVRALLVAPEQIEQRYFHDSEVEKRARAHRDELVPISQVLRQLRHRETQLQVVLGLELLPASPDVEPLVDHHFDRLCIWQAVGDYKDALAEFCSAVVLPFYKSRCPHKTKQFVQRSRGTLKSRSRSRKPIKDMAVPAVPLPTGGGLLKALHITGSNAAAKPLPEVPADPKPAPSLRPSAAVRSASHPLYTMASRQNTVEVRFKRSRRHEPVPASAVSSVTGAAPSPAATSTPFATTTSATVASTGHSADGLRSSSTLAASVSALPQAPQSPPPLPRHVNPALPDSIEKKVQATPRKERSRFLESLNQPLPLDFDVVESTDSDE